MIIGSRGCGASLVSVAAEFPNRVLENAPYRRSVTYSA
jgi:hypothetical protein